MLRELPGKGGSGVKRSTVCAAVVLLALAAKATGGMSATVTTLASLIVLMPGMALTNAMTELTTRHLAAGTARLAASIRPLVFGVTGAASTT